MRLTFYFLMMAFSIHIHGQSTLIVNVMTPDGIPIEGVKIFDEYTDENGELILATLPTGPHQVKVEATYSDRPNRCLSDSDINAIQERLADSTIQWNFYQTLAADINRSEDISAIDISSLRKTIVSNVWGQGYDQWIFGGKEDWSVTTADLSGTNDTVHFSLIGVKMGNVDNNYRCLLTFTVDHSDFSMRIYPNPGTDQLFIDEELESISVYNTSGLKMIKLENPGNELDVSQLLKGSYLILGEIGTGGRVHQRWVKL